MKKVLLVAVVGLAALGVATNYEVPLALALGWVAFLNRVLPRMTADWPSLAVAAVALLLFTAGIHFIGGSLRRRWLAGTEGAGPAWRARWSLTVVALFFLMFAAGLCLIGITHQVAWLGSDKEPLLGEVLRESQRRTSQSNLRWLGMATANYSGVTGSLPQGGTVAPDGRPLHSWETPLLPYLGWSIREIDLTVPWNDPKNAPYFRSVLPDFINPEFRPAPLTDADGFGLSHYAANVQVMGAGKGMKASEITDGTSNTLLVGEVNANFRPWGHPGNWRDPAKGINKSPNGFGGPRFAGGAQFLMADGSVRFVSERVSPAVLRALSTPAGGEDVDLSGLENPR